MKKNNLKKLGTISALCLSLFTTVPVNALTKNETVYSKIDTNGNVIKTTVTDKLINDNKLDTITDLTDLDKIINLSNNNTFNKDNNQITWNTSGNNLTYQGTSNKELPISINISYKLDGNSITVDDLLGKSGHVDITLKYTNNERNLVYVNGTNTYLYTPFIVTMGTIIKDTDATNLKITNGKIINNGLSNILVGISAPGLYESLNMYELKDLDTITISYDTTSFNLPTIYNVATSKLLEDNDLSIFNKLNTLTSASTSLKENIDALTEGSNKLLESSITLNNGTSQIYQNLSYVNQKLKEINEGAINLDNGLNDIINTLNKVKESLNNSSNDESIGKLKLLIDTDLNTANNLKAMNDTLKANYEEYNLKNITYKEAITADPTMNLYNLKLAYENNYENNNQLITLLNSNASALTETLTTLNNIDTEVSNMLSTLTTYLEKAHDGSTELANGTTALSTGVNTLTTKVEELYNGTTALSEGINTLNTGITAYNEEGITPLSNTINNNLSGNINKIKKLADLGNNYQTFTMKNTTDNGETKFIIVLDGQKVEKTTVKTETKTEKLSFIDRIKNLFK